MGIVEQFTAKLDNKRLALLVGGAAAVAGVAIATSSCSKSRQAKEGRASTTLADSNRTASALDSKEGVLTILQEMAKSQSVSRQQLKELAAEAQAKSLTLSQACVRCTQMGVADPLAKHKLSMVDFNIALSEYEDDPAVQQAISTLVGSPPHGVAATEASQALTDHKLIEINNFMLAEFEKLAACAEKRSRGFEAVTTFAAQAVVAGQTEAVFKVSLEDIEAAVLAHQGALACNDEFSSINLKLQQAIAKLACS
eukprot:TRINITY_DN8510_c0_g3_i1.p1 TRINITY_DN8510_c0_g3~~TRINITY_DN8510_c0_g3_i1.p1  ORF type:complete len:280 (-),score=49.85 TRINITY_DN8510_c0_g3_i1:134-895(-)